MDATTPIAQIQTAAATGERGVPRLEQPKPVDEKAARLRKLEKATSDFEAIFLGQLLKPLAKSISSTSKGSQLGGDVMLGVAMEKMADALAEKGGIGLGDLMLRNLKDRIAEDTVATVPPKDMGIPLGPDKIEPKELPRQGQPSPMDLNSVKSRPVKGD